MLAVVPCGGCCDIIRGNYFCSFFDGREWPSIVRGFRYLFFVFVFLITGFKRSLYRGC